MHFEKKTLQRIFLGVGICILLYWFLHETEQVNGVMTLLKNIFSPFILGAGLAFIINVPNAKVITAITQDEMGESVFTNIDGAVIA